MWLQSGARARSAALKLAGHVTLTGCQSLPAIIPLSDGQTISILFHSPTAEKPGSPIAIRWLLSSSY
ncbi:hypothetical protein KZ779_03305 [Escherichia coli]|nr:hypothetical protein [Escherichia coli]